MANGEPEMTIKLSCPSCGNQFRTRAEEVSGSYFCKNCGNPLKVSEEGVVTVVPDGEPGSPGEAGDQIGKPTVLDGDEPDEDQADRTVLDVDDRALDQRDVPRKIPVRLASYDIEKELGRGSMVVVYKGYQPELDRPVAIKLMIAGEYSSGQMKERFQREARAVARLDHPNVVTIHEVGTHEEMPFFSMDFIDGRSIAELTETSAIDPEVAAELMVEICDGIHRANEQGIIHRDVKPENILLDRDGTPKVTDFGLAKDLAPPSTCRPNRRGARCTAWTSERTSTRSGPPSTGW